MISTDFDLKKGLDSVLIYTMLQWIESCFAVQGLLQEYSMKYDAFIFVLILDST